MPDTDLTASRILIVDDQEPNVLVLEAMLEQAGYTNLHSLTDPRDVIPWCAMQRPDLILLDLHMPHVDGFAVLEELNRLRLDGDAPLILVLTADITVEAKRRALSIGAKDFVTKPFDRPEVLLRVRNLLETRARYQQMYLRTEQLESRLRDQARLLQQTEEERTRARMDIEEHAVRDPLTGLPNRYRLQQMLERLLATARDTGGGLALLLLDLDRFKDVNDTLGHQYGDMVLVEVAARLRRMLRDVDVLARLGGDEYGVIVPGARAAGAMWAARKILNAFAKPIVVDGTMLPASASVGVAFFPDHGSNAADLLRHAEIAMYAAKRAESGCVVYAPEQDPYDVSRLVLMSALRQAIADNRLSLEYQPKVYMNTGRTYGVEALARWTHPEFGHVPPDRFIAVAEQGGMIGALTQWVVEAALIQCHSWHRAGLMLNVGINLSMRLFEDAHFAQTIAALLLRYGIAPEYVTLEITESVLTLEQARVQEALGALAALGVRLSIDDVGTGSSSLGSLSRLPLHEMKIDKSLISEIATQPRTATLVRSLIGLGHSLGLDVVAEGVEHLTQWRALMEWGCQGAQGYYLSRALPPTELLSWLLSSRHGISRVVN